MRLPFLCRWIGYHKWKEEDYCLTWSKWRCARCAVETYDRRWVESHKLTSAEERLHREALQMEPDLVCGPCLVPRGANALYREGFQISLRGKMLVAEETPEEAWRTVIGLLRGEHEVDLHGRKRT